MANADKKHHGPAVQGKGDGTGGMTDLDASEIPANAVLSNRDKSRHSEERGLDSKAVQTEQLQDHAGARLADDPAEGAPDPSTVDPADLAAADLDRDGEGATARIADIVEDKE
ncbi:hypothetical protein [Tabrizicola sp.]|uniref:hypothetical protein n=1 Tax=Tabrizicola sp. TaxID=2005166 RepID=UPI0025F77924|nr:hypothetical protein [Tabrizicola sp.]